MVISSNVSASFGGLSGIALGPPLQKLFERWNVLETVMACIMRFIFFILPRNFLMGSSKAVKTEVGFLVLVLISLYCYYENPSKQGETGEKGYRSTLRLIHFEAFTLMSLSLSTQAQPGFKLDTSNLLLPCLVLAIIKNNFMVGVGVAVVCYLSMSSRSYLDSRRQKRLRGRGVVVRETPQILSSLSLIIHPSPSLSTLRRRPVNLDSSYLRRASQKLVKTCHQPYTNLEWLLLLNTPSPIVLRHISFKTLNCVSLSPSGYSTLLSSEWSFREALPHRRLLTFWLPESRTFIPSNALRLPQSMGPDDNLFNFIPNNYY